MPVSDCEVRDPRIRRTRQLLQGALRILMRTKGFEEITVQDIADEATVNRATFYDHYTDKYALLDAMVAGDFHGLLHERHIHYDGTCPSAAGALILAACDYMLQTHSGETECQRQSAFEPLIEAAITSAIRRTLMEGIAKNEARPEAPPGMVATAASWAIFGAVKEWFHTPNRTATEEAMPLILALVMPILLTGAPAGSHHPVTASS